MAGSTHTTGTVSIADHASDAARLLDHISVSRAHVVGHSSGGAIALQLALDHPDRVETLVLLEPAMLWVPAAEAFFAKAGPSVEAYNAGNHEEAVATFLSAASGLDWQTCRSMIERNVPGGVDQAIADADTFFTIELPAIAGWRITADQAATIRKPVLSSWVRARTRCLWRPRSCYDAGSHRSRTSSSTSDICCRWSSRSR